METVITADSSAGYNAIENVRTDEVTVSVSLPACLLPTHTRPHKSLSTNPLLPPLQQVSSVDGTVDYTHRVTFIHSPLDGSVEELRMRTTKVTPAGSSSSSSSDRASSLSPPPSSSSNRNHSSGGNASCSRATAATSSAARVNSPRPRTRGGANWLQRALSDNF